MSPIQRLCGVVAVLATCGATSQAVTIPTVPVGNPGNVGDTVGMDDGSTGYGSVPYTFYLGTYDVTNSQYMAFLNAKDPTGANALALWNSNMANAAIGGISFNSGGLNGAKYSVISGDGNHPVNFVTWYDAVRFANWLNNGQGTGDTETGAYTLLGGTPTPWNDGITRNAGARVFLPSENEWYKAAYYNPTTSSYFAYPTSSNSAPTASAPSANSNSANYNNVVAHPTDVGAYTGTTSPYGAFDMGGNVFQWNEARIPPSRGALGMTWADFIGDGNDDEMSSEDRHGFGPTTESNGIGFRVASMSAVIGSPVGEWFGITDSNWATASNWFGEPGATTGTTNTDTATFNLNAPNSPLTIDAGRNLKNITFDTANVNSMTIGTTAGNALLLTAGGTVQTTSTVVNLQVLNCPLVLEGDYTFTSGAASRAATLTFGGRITPGATSGVTTLTLGGINTGNNTISGILADNGGGKLAVAMAGPGVWALSGANTFSGDTTVTGGQLILKNSAALQMSTLSLAVDNGVAFAAGLGSATLGGLTGNGKLALQDQATTPAAVNAMVGNNGTSTTYGGILSGSGSLTKVGAGTLMLVNSNTYTGGTTINAGTLQLGDGISANGSIAGNIADKTTLVFANPNSQTYSGVISGTGSVVKAAAGTLLLSGANSFAGGLSVRQGTLSIPTINNFGASGPIGAGPSVSLGSMGQTSTLEYTGGTASSTMPFSLAAGGSGTFQIDTAATNLSLSGVVSGSGALTKSGPGTLTLAGNDTFTGGLTTTGPGTLILAGNNSFAGGVMINAGMLQLGNSGALNATTPNAVRFGPASTGILNLGGSGNITVSSLQSNSVPGSPIVENANASFGQVSTLTVNDSGTDTFAGLMRDDPLGQGYLAIAKSGGGTLILTGANTYTGGTTINSGSLQLGDGATSNGSVVGHIADNAGLIFANPNPQVYSDNVVGSGSVTKSGAGALTLSGNNGFTGGLTVQQGTLVISTINYAGIAGPLGASANVTLASSGQAATLEYTGGTALSNMPFTLAMGGNSAFQIDLAAASLTLSGILSGGGSLTKAGNGTLILTGTNTFTGGTTIAGGNLQLGDGATSNGSVVGNLTDNAGLIFANPNAQVFSGLISGTGSLTKSASGALTLGGNNSFTGGLTVQQGTLIIPTINNALAIGSLGANSSVTLSSNGQTVTLEYTGGTAASNMPFTLTAGGNSTFQIDAAAASLTLSGSLSGGGNLTKVGPGTIILAGNNSYTGSTTVNNGALTTTGTLGAGPLAVNGNGGAISAVTFGTSQSIASLSGTVSGGGPAIVNVIAGKTLTINQASNTTFAGAIGLAAGGTAGGGGAFVKSGSGTLEIDGGLALGNYSSLAISGGKLRLNMTTAAGSIGSGVTANISNSAVLELAGSASALGTSTPGNRVTITNTSSAAAGLLVSAGNQQVGGINGNGKTQINAGTSLTADHIIQSALTIGGMSGSRGRVVIEASDSSGSPLAGAVAPSLGELVPNSLDFANATLTSGAPNVDSTTGAGLFSPTIGSASPDANSSPVPEPATWISMLLALFALLLAAFYSGGLSTSHPRCFSAAKSAKRLPTIASRAAASRR